MAQVDIKGLSKASVFKALYDNAQVIGMGVLNAVASDMSLSEAEKTVKKSLHFVYHKGRVMKVDINDDTFEDWLYDRDNGIGAAKKAIDALRK